MKIVGRELLTVFKTKYSDAQNWIEAWVAEVESAQWEKPQNIRDRYASASFLAENIIIFNVKGNHYRLEVKVSYKTETVLVRWIGTHEEYTRRFRGGAN